MRCIPLARDVADLIAVAALHDALVGALGFTMAVLVAVEALLAATLTG